MSVQCYNLVNVIPVRYSHMWLFRPKEVRFIICWFDLWIGAYWDRSKGALYIMFLPCVGLYLRYRDEAVDIYDVPSSEVIRTIQYLNRWNEPGAAKVVEKLACDVDHWKNKYSEAHKQRYPLP